MNSLELVRRLYEGETDLTALEQKLDESAREELRQLVEAKEALETMPRRKPSANVIEAVVAKAVQREKRRSPLSLIVANRTLQRLAAAAVVVVAIGVGYLTLTRDGLLPVDKSDLPAVSAEAPLVAEEDQVVGQNEAESIAEAPAKSTKPSSRSEVRSEVRSAAPPAPQATGEAGRSIVRRDLDEVGAIGGARPSEEDVSNDSFALLDGEAALADSSLKKEGRKADELLTWEQDEEAFRTFFWQVRALDGRSPAEDWEEAVPLEGSFQQLEKQQPGGDRWLQTGSEKR